MPNDDHHAPRLYPGVMVSSTFTDLKEHRAALIQAINGHGLMHVGMENASAKPGVDVLDSSLQMVRDGSAYVGVISHKYGQIPDCLVRNPTGLSLTELEFNEARRIGRPVLLFIMGKKHKVDLDDIELDPDKQRKLEAFRENAKRSTADSSVHRVYKVFNNLHEFEVAATHAVAELRRFLDERTKSTMQLSPPTLDSTKPNSDPIPKPPGFYAEPAYIGSHNFVGRQAQLDTLSDWAAPADSHPILLFEAIGGAGKSMLTWEWTNKHATGVRADWAGRFWYSFYEKGAIMADFCRRALAYITGQPLEDFRKTKTVELGELLLHHLQDRPWLLILDGLERVLVAYHRFDAAQLADEEAGTTDQIAHRDPCAAIRPEDDELLHALAAAAPSKLLLTSRLIPRVLLNPASQPIPGVLRVPLPGLRPIDAEELLRACGVTGTSQDIQSYLKSHCDCHPLVTGVLSGLINHYLPDRGNFDAWAADPSAGGNLNLANLDLVQKRNHILHAALSVLTEKSRQLLSTLALLSEAVDYPTLRAINPHLRSEQSHKDRQQSPELLTASKELEKTVTDLERRGLLQYGAQSKRYDLHPVVRCVTVGGLGQEEKDRYGQRVVDYFSQQAHSPYDEAETLDDVRDGLHVVRTLLQMGRYQQACDAYLGDLSGALLFNLEARAEVLSLLRPFFPHGWATLPDGLRKSDGAKLASYVAHALTAAGELNEAIAAFGSALLVNVSAAHWSNVQVELSNISNAFAAKNRLATQQRCGLLVLDLATLADDEEDLFCARYDRFRQLAVTGQSAQAEAMWGLIDPMGRSWSRNVYRPGQAEYHYALFRFWQGNLTEKQLAIAERLSKAGKDRSVIRALHGVRGEWRLEHRQWALAADSLREAVRMAREVGRTDAYAEAQLALANVHLRQLPDPRHEAEQLSRAKVPSHRPLAELWLAIGDAEQAKKHALAAYEWAWADGEPYVRRYELNKARALLEQLGAEIPDLPRYDAANDEKLPWEDEVAAAIEKLRA